MNLECPCPYAVGKLLPPVHAANILYILVYTVSVLRHASKYSCFEPINRTVLFYCYQYQSLRNGGYVRKHRVYSIAFTAAAVDVDLYLFCLCFIE